MSIMFKFLNSLIIDEMKTDWNEMYIQHDLTVNTQMCMTHTCKQEKTLKGYTLSCDNTDPS